MGVDRAKVLSHWNTIDDLTQDKYEDKFYYWPWPRWLRRKIALTDSEALAAQNYINFIVKRNYPYNLHERMGRELWVEFCEYWGQNPDLEKALRYL